MAVSSPDRVRVLQAARLVADYASTQGLPTSYAVPRSTYEHVGALLADAVLQPGLNHHAVVEPRVARILDEFPEANCVTGVICCLENGSTAHFLDWQHPTKLERFECLVGFLHTSKIDTGEDIRTVLKSEQFRAELQSVRGVGPKTVDYMSCLVGIESVAVDRHIRAFAARAGVESEEYDFLKSTFCFAADLLSISRREFDAWVWSREASKQSPQLSFVL